MNTTAPISTLYCQRCQRPFQSGDPKVTIVHTKLVRAWVVHGGYGCDTGCCGYWIYAEDATGRACSGGFEFIHIYDENVDVQEWITDLIRELYEDVPIDFDACKVVPGED